MTTATLPRDLRAAAATLGPSEARFLVDLYYQMQKSRVRANNQIKGLVRDAARRDGEPEPHDTLAWFLGEAHDLEKDIKGALNAYSDGQELGIWAKAQVGVGPVIAAGLLAHIDIAQAPTVGHIWRFAGLDPTCVWREKEKRPWNASLKRLCWIMGESFKKFSGHEECVYGHAYRDRKEYELRLDEEGKHAEAAERSLAERKIKDKELRAIYESGRLPAGRLDLRATRYATKLFLAHYHECGYALQMGCLPPKPYVIEHLGHADYVTAPNPPDVLVKLRAASRRDGERRER